jgi:alanyl-tRNA synthetase
MDSKEIRKIFLDFFKSKSHPIIPSSSLIPEGDSSLLFTTAGMVQFKPYYLGLKTDLKRAASCQKCFRTTDIDNVGRTIRHLTFFEMLGNFSFGDYFKKETLEWGFEFLVNVMKIDPKRLYFSYYAGGNAPKDEEALEIWKSILPKELHSHIFEMGEDNFWSMGETGPSGPCSEIYFDRGEIYHRDCPGPKCGCDRYIEIWNHVFTQFDRQVDGSFKPLPKKNIDTGMGLERLCFIVENKFSPFETTLFSPIIKKFIEDNKNIFNSEYKEMSDIVLKQPDQKDYYEELLRRNAFDLFIPTLRIVADHIRGASFLVSEGVIPSNEGRGYILRRLIRRTMRYSMLCGVKETYLYNLVDSVNKIYDGVYPQISENMKHIKNVIKYEEEGFLETLEKGEKYLYELINSSKKITGEDAFKLYETYGFPYELTKEIALKNGIEIDDNEFENARKKASEISRKWKGEEDKIKFHKIDLDFPQTNFEGYEFYEIEAKLLGIINENAQKYEKADNGFWYLVFDKTPFYAEGGGQISDTGVIEDLNGNIVAKVLDVLKPLGRVFYHKVEVLSTIKVGDKFKLKIDVYRRKKIAANHTATHLVNAALKIVFGPNTVQAGSFVGDEKFRFDYTINKTPTPDELKMVEDIANQAILKGYKVYKDIRPLSDAKVLGATILVGEKYSDPARFVLINKDGFKNYNERYSLELCGGTHVDDLRDVFRVKIIKDSSVSKGIRRIEGLSGYSLIEWYENIEKILLDISSIFDCYYDEVKERVEKLREENKTLKNKIFSTLKSDDEEYDTSKGKVVFVKVDEPDMKIIRNLADKKKASKKNSFIVVYSIKDGKISFAMLKTPDVSHSVKTVFEQVKNILNLSAGGRDDFIQGGGKVENEDDFKKKILSVF